MLGQNFNQVNNQIINQVNVNNQGESTMTINNMSAAELIKYYNSIAPKTIGLEAPIIFQVNEQRISQLGAYRSTLISYDLNPAINPGVSGTVYLKGSEQIKLPATLSFPVSIWNLKTEERTFKNINKQINDRFKYLVKKGDTVKNGDPLYEVAEVKKDSFLKGAVYNKGIDFTFEVEKIRKIEKPLIDGNTAQVTVRIDGFHLTKSNAEKVAGDGAKMCFTPNPMPENLNDLQYGGVLLYETVNDHKHTIELINSNSIESLPMPEVVAGSEAIKGDHVIAQLYAATNFCINNEPTIVDVKERTDIEGLESKVAYWSNEQVEAINQFKRKSIRTITAVREFSDRFAAVLKKQYADNNHVTFIGNVMYITGEAIIGIHHTTTELSLTEENRSSQKGKVYFEGLAVLADLNPNLGRLLQATGYDNRRLADLFIQSANAITNGTEVVWDNTYYHPIPDNSSTVQLLMNLPKRIIIKSAGNESILIIKEVAIRMGLTPTGGVNLIAKLVANLSHLFSVPLEQRGPEWDETKQMLCNSFYSNIDKQVKVNTDEAYSKNKMLKEVTKTGNVAYTMKVRGVEAPWVKANDVYLPSNDPWALKLQGHSIIWWRNPLPKYFQSTVKIVGPSTAATVNGELVQVIPDIITPKQVIAKACLSVPAIEWYGVNNGDDDGDLVSFLSLDELYKWAKNPRNKKAIDSVPGLAKLF